MALELLRSLDGEPDADASVAWDAGRCATMVEPADPSIGIQLTLGEAAMLNLALLELNRYNENGPGVGLPLECRCLHQPQPTTQTPA